MARRLAEVRRQAGKLRETALQLEKLAAQYPPNIEFLEQLMELCDVCSLELEYCQTLLQFFELHYAGRNFERAGECLTAPPKSTPMCPAWTRSWRCFAARSTTSA